MAEPQLQPALAAEIARQIANPEPAASSEIFKRAMTSVPIRMQSVMADSLASSQLGARVLLDAIEQGLASARLLQSPVLEQKLLATGLDGVGEDIGRLTSASNIILPKVSLRQGTPPPLHGSRPLHPREQGPPLQPPHHPADQRLLDRHRYRCHNRCTRSTLARRGSQSGRSLSLFMCVCTIWSISGTR